MKEFKNKRIFILLGTSGSGKSKLGMELRKVGIPELVSHTSREIRINDGEVEGINYYYRTKEEIKNLDMIEYAEYDNELYGLSTKEVETKLSKYDTVYAITEIRGVEQIKARYGDMVTVIYVNVSPENAKERMLSRGDKPEKIESRIRNAVTRKEYEDIKYADFIIDNNGTLENSKRQLFDIIFGKNK